MSRRLGVVMDPIDHINIKKDTSFALLLAAQARGWSLHYLEQRDLYLYNGRVHGRARPLTVRDDPAHWFELGAAVEAPLADQLDLVLMRKDPPFDQEYLYSTYLLELAEADGLRVINRPGSIRDANEKLFAAWFPQCTPPTLVSRDMALIKRFLAEHGRIVVKPLDGMGGSGIFRIDLGDQNTGSILETLTQRGQQTIMAQRYLPEISAGDKRILLLHGVPVDHCLARIPAAGEARGNLAAGGTGVVQPISDRDRWIAEQVAPKLLEKGLIFVGLDVIGDYLTEINVTSPTCLREIAKATGRDLADEFLAGLAPG
ncbi:glutathione synthase [Permianibacter sp. IMCC34836]|uniref:glutathione synthase n=1 Tax=Permianibacter fluminis TaxID=2738515 RepID=UPI0015553D80|nr:glutathione synthase [Permianibacter fluminis]NQD35805.1 glutathione synthase [Permianibacter fluminis]